MELIFKIQEQPGRPAVISKLSGQRITIGRAFDNDLIISDHAINPYHAVIESDENGHMYLHDLNSLNGIYHDRTQKIVDKFEIKSGSEFRFGKTIISIFTVDHPVVDAVEYRESNALTQFLDNPQVIIGAIFVVALIHALEQWLNMFGEFKWQDIVNGELYIFGWVLLIGIFWAIIGRIFKHVANFKKHITVILVFIAARFLLTIFINLLLFNSLNNSLSISIMLIFEFGLISVMLWFNLLMATNQSSRQRFNTAVTISLMIIALTLYSEINTDSDIPGNPEYVKILKPPAMQVSGSVTENDYLSSVAVVFENLNAE